MFVIIVILIWAVAMGIWFLCSNAFRHADVDRFKNRLLGSHKAKKEKAQHGPNLIHAENHGLVVRIMHRLRLQTRVQELLEQAGLRSAHGVDDGPYLWERPAPADPDLPPRPVLLLRAVAERQRWHAEYTAAQLAAAGQAPPPDNCSATTDQAA